MVVIDSSVPQEKARQLAGNLRKQGIACHSVRHDGAFVMKW
jgi:hypothetical protein